MDPALIALIAQGSFELIKLGLETLEAINTNQPQDVINAKWEAQRAKYREIADKFKSVET